MKFTVFRSWIEFRFEVVFLLEAAVSSSDGMLPDESLGYKVAAD